MPAQLARLTTDRAAMEEGEWITVGTAPDTFDLRVKGFTAAYRDALAGERRLAARDLNRTVAPGGMSYTPDTLPPSVDDACQGRAMAQHCLLDVRGLLDGETPVTADALREMLSDPAGLSGLLVLTIQAASRVGADRDQQRQAAEGN